MCLCPTSCVHLVLYARRELQLISRSTYMHSRCIQKRFSPSFAVPQPTPIFCIEWMLFVAMSIFFGILSQHARILCLASAVSRTAVMLTLEINSNVCLPARHTFEFCPDIHQPPCVLLRKTTYLSGSTRVEVLMRCTARLVHNSKHNGKVGEMADRHENMQRTNGQETEERLTTPSLLLIKDFFRPARAFIDATWRMRPCCCTWAENRYLNIRLIKLKFLLMSHNRGQGDTGFVFLQYV